MSKIGITAALPSLKMGQKRKIIGQNSKYGQSNIEFKQTKYIYKTRQKKQFILKGYNQSLFSQIKSFPYFRIRDFDKFIKRQFFRFTTFTPESKNVCLLVICGMKMFVFSNPNGER